MKFKPLSTEKVIKVPVKIGFQVIKQKGSHVFLRHPGGRTQLFRYTKKKVLEEAFY